jgi:hypothetical protein
VLLPRRWIVGRSWHSGDNDYERLLHTVAWLHFVALACLFFSGRPPRPDRVHNTL